MRARWRNWSLRTQISLSVMAIMLLLLTLFSVVLFTAVRAFLIDQSTTQLEVQVRALLGDSAAGPGMNRMSSRIETAPLSDRQRVELENLVMALTTGTTSAVVYQADAGIVAQSEMPQHSTRYGPPWVNGRGSFHMMDAPPALDRQAFDRALRGADEVSFTAGAGLDRQIAILVPVYDNNRLTAVVQVSTSLSPVTTLLRWLFTALLGGTLIVSGLALLLSLWTTRVIVEPLKRLVSVTQQVAAGDLTTRSNLSSRNEIGTLGTSFDHMVAQLQTTFAAQRRFIADAAHELRTPLTAVGGQLELLLMGAVSDPAQQRRSLQRMNSELERTGRLVDDLLTLSRLDARPVLRHEPVDLAALAHDVAQSIRDLAPDQHVAVSAPTPLIVAGDPDRLRQVLLNVLDNARKYTPAGGDIRVDVQRRDGSAIVTIADTGIGIPAADVPHIWDRFYRVDQARTRASGGSGLGLAIVKGIIEAHGGSVALSSQPGLGTSVTLRFPLAGSGHLIAEHARQADSAALSRSSQAS